MEYTRPPGSVNRVDMVCGSAKLASMGDYTPNDIGPPDSRRSYEEIAYREEFMAKLAEGRDPELEMLQERIDYYHDQEVNRIIEDESNTPL